MLRMHAVQYRYGRSKPLFEDLELELKPGNIYGLLGKNGAGKTTLLNLVAGMIFPKNGSIEVFGTDSRKRAPHVLADVFFLPETFVLPDIGADVYRSVIAPFYPLFERKLFDAAMSDLEIDPDQHLSRMSYGQQKKFMLAFGLACGARLNLLDEPTNGLDIPAKSQFRKLIATHVSDDRTFLISTHQARDLQGLIDPIIIVDSGKIVFQYELYEVERRIRCKSSVQEPSGVVLYSERNLDSWTVVEERPDGEASTAAEGRGGMDLELLFNAVVGAPDRVRRIMEVQR